MSVSKLYAGRHSKDRFDKLRFTDEDIQYLDANFRENWKLEDSNPGWAGLIISEFPIPDGFQQNFSTLMLIVPNGYPGTQLDMFYFSPALVKSNGEAIGNLVEESHFGSNWQRWSRHYTWCPGEDSLISHIEYIKNELSVEANK